MAYSERQLIDAGWFFSQYDLYLERMPEDTHGWITQIFEDVCMKHYGVDMGQLRPIVEDIHDRWRKEAEKSS